MANGIDPRTLQAMRGMGLGSLLPNQPSAVNAIAHRPAVEPRGNPLTRIDTARISIAGGQLISYLTHPATVPVEDVWRRLPVDGIFTASPAQPFTFECGSFPVPPQQSFVLMDYFFSIYRPSGIAPGDAVPLEANRLSTQIGWDYTASSKRQGNVAYELTPIPPNPTQSSYGAANFVNGGLTLPGASLSRATADQFAAAAQNLNQGVTAAGSSLMPQRHHRQGILRVPVPFVVQSGDQLQFRCSVFNAISVPIAFFEVEMFGILMPSEILQDLLNAIAPVVPKEGP